MVAKLHWTPQGEPDRVSGDTSHDHLALVQTFGQFPRLYTEADIRTLRGMACVHGEEGNPYQALIDLIDKYGPVSIDLHD